MTIRTPLYPTSNSYVSRLTFDKKIIILNGETFSDEIDLGGANIICISTPSNIVGDYLYFYIWDGETFKKAYSPDLSADIEMRMKILPDVAYPMVATDGAPFKRIKFKTDIAQTSDVTINLVCRSLA